MAGPITPPVKQLKKQDGRMSNQVKCKVNVQLKARVKRATPPERLMPDTPQLNKQQTHHRQMVTNNSIQVGLSTMAPSSDH